MGPIPKGAFLTKGVGRHREKLTSFELALRSAGIAEFNLVRVKSIFPPNCKLLSQQEGLKYLSPGQIVFAVMSDNATNEPHRLIASSVGVAHSRQPCATTATCPSITASARPIRRPATMPRTSRR